MILPITFTQQVQDGCVTASARSFIPHLGIDFENVFLPKLQKYSLDSANGENNHMLGVAAVAAQMGLQVGIHKAEPLLGDILPDSVPESTRMMHKMVTEYCAKLANEGNLISTTGNLDIGEFTRREIDILGDGNYTLIILDWLRWNSKAQAKFGNLNHIVTVYGIKNGLFWVADPAIPITENPVRVTPEFLYGSLLDKQQLISIGKLKISP